ncbi:MAG: ribonuclease III [Proteobacteria bacterium]|nr:ribonuclease III [Pseudomonadota bacterium]
MTTNDQLLQNPLEDKNLWELEEEIGYTFGNRQLLVQALTHKSFAHEHKLEDNERLEFLGDAILQFVISDHLMTSYPSLPEGMLSKFRAVLVSENGLSQLAKKMDLGRYLFIGKGEEITGGREKNSILSDAVEALLSAVFLDSREEWGIAKIADIIRRLFHGEIKTAEKTFATVDYKTDFQEYVQKNKMGVLSYKIIEETGPDHEKEFVTALMIADRVYGIGRGKSKKISEQNAAINAFEKLNEQNDG